MAKNKKKTGGGSIFPIFDEGKRGQRNIAIAIDGGGIKGTMVAKALADLENELRVVKGTDGKPILGKQETLNKLIRLFVGTSTGSILAASLAMGVNAGRIHDLYEKKGPNIFSSFFSFCTLTKFGQLAFKDSIYGNDDLRDALKEEIGESTLMGHLFEKRDAKGNPKIPIDLILTTMDLGTYKSRFIKPYNKPSEEDIKGAAQLGKKEPDFTKWKVIDAVLASCAVPLYFPMISDYTCNSDFADGGVGAYGNPSYLAAYEIFNILNKDVEREKPTDTLIKEAGFNWDPRKTTLISIGTGKPKPLVTHAGQWKDFKLKDWAEVVINSFSQSTSDQQKSMVDLLSENAENKKSDKDENGFEYRRSQMDFGAKDSLLPEKYKRLQALYNEKVEVYINEKLDQLRENGETVGNVDKFKEKYRSKCRYSFDRNIEMDSPKEIPILSVLGKVLCSQIISGDETTT